MNEDKFIDNVTSFLPQQQDIVVGPGDDCAVIDIPGSNKYYIMSVDQLISDIHFDSKTTTPVEVGKKLINRNISDIAAMGGEPAHAVLTVASNFFDMNWYNEFYKSLSCEAQKWNVSICGGDTASLQKWSSLENKNAFIATLTITGYVAKDRVCLRKNAKVGDSIFVTGKLGNSYNSKHHINFTPRVSEAQIISQYSNCMMDISDGLLKDLERICKQSNVSANITESNLPLRENASISQALSDGEDYELLFTVSQEQEKKLLANWNSQTKLTKIGVITEKATISISGISASNTKIGYDHIK